MVAKKRVFVNDLMCNKVWYMLRINMKATGGTLRPFKLSFGIHDMNLHIIPLFMLLL